MDFPTRKTKGKYGSRSQADWLRMALASAIGTKPTLLWFTCNLFSKNKLKCKRNPRSQHPFGLKKHSFVEVCIPLTGESLFELETGYYGISHPSVIIVTPNTTHCECYARRDAAYSLFWISVSGPAFIAHVSRYRPGGKWDCPARWQFRGKYAHRLFDRFANLNDSAYLQQLEQTHGDILAILSRLYEQVCYQKTKPTRKTAGKIERYTPMLLNVRTFIDNHLGDSLGLEGLAGLTGLSPNYLNHLFSQWSGETIHTYIIHRRMELAMRLCHQGDMLIKQIARTVGYEDPLYFSRAFYRYYGRWPSEVL